MPGIRILQIDAFTDRPFAGNPAAVCLLDEERDASWMQAVAAEMNLSETAFVRPLGDGFELRWFTPAIEVDLCGHATLASAHALWCEGVLAGDSLIRFHTRSGVLTCKRDGTFIELDFPATPVEDSEPPEGLLDALGVQPSFVGKPKFDRFVVVESEQMQNRRVEIVYVQAILDCVQTNLVGRANGLAAFHSATRHPHRKAVGIVVAAVAFFAHRSPSKLAAPNHERLIQ